jgi:hypothetical protein
MFKFKCMFFSKHLQLDEKNCEGQDRRVLRTLNSGEMCIVRGGGGGVLGMGLGLGWRWGDGDGVDGRGGDVFDRTALVHSNHLMNANSTAVAQKQRFSPLKQKSKKLRTRFKKGCVFDIFYCFLGF